jgi:hypothetical protein
MKEYRTIIRVISNVPQPTEGAFSSVQVDAEIMIMLESGWTLQSTHYLGQMPTEGVIPSQRFIFAWMFIK